MTTRKCYSKCRKRIEDECGPPECRYINGSRRKYCRLSYAYKMDENCIAHPKPIKSKTATRKNKKIGEPVNKMLTERLKEERLKERLNEMKMHGSRKIIKKFMINQDPHKRRSRFLQNICSDSGVCITFGKESDKIKKHFGGFIDPKYMKPPIKRIGNPSTNGFVNEIAYDNQGYTANAILKSTYTPESDNLLFEYLVGQFINKKNLFCPCFVETYAWLLYNDESKWTHVKNTKNNMTNIFTNALTVQPSIIHRDKLKIACTKSKHLAILIQHIKHATPLSSKTSSKFFKYELLYVLYQVYMPLSMLAFSFTHYDLHKGNVLLYEPVKGAYIEYNYHLADGSVVNFNSSYLVKLIDYGRSFFIDPSLPKTDFKHSSASIYQTVCNTPDCNPYCGEKYGFSWGTPIQNKNTYFISSSIRNMSHDLRLIPEILADSISSIKKNNPELHNIMKMVSYGVGIKNKATILYGTKEQVDSKLPNNIVNVIDMHTELKELIMDPNFITHNNEYFKSKNKLGTLNVYTDGRDMTYTQFSKHLPDSINSFELSTTSSTDYFLK